MKSIFSIKRLLLSSIFLAVTLFPFFKPHHVYACSCIFNSSYLFPISYLSYDVIFTGKVIDMGSDSFFINRPVHFSIYRAFKGVSGNETTVYTSGSSSSCGYTFETGKEYIVYGSKTNYGISTGLCTGTTELSNAKKSLTYSIIASVIFCIILILFGAALLFPLFLIMKFLILIVKTIIKRGS